MHGALGAHARRCARSWRSEPAWAFHASRIGPKSLLPSGGYTHTPQVCTELEKRAGMEQLELVARDHALLKSSVQQGNTMARWGWVTGWAQGRAGNEGLPASRLEAERGCFLHGC